ncbi:MAG: redoxin domain-containing protein, partial [Armatimonadota bacterium]|nr:redoxin domain-containing protein [Armatimonadota bacterium]
MGVEVGQQAPDVTLVSADRKAVRLSEFRGRPTVLAFFPGAYTATCTKEMCALR